MRRTFETIKVETNGSGVPSRIAWRGRRFVVGGVQDRWRYCGRWWQGGGGSQRQYFRVEVRARYSGQPRSLELYREGHDWTLSQLCD